MCSQWFFSSTNCHFFKFGWRLRNVYMKFSYWGKSLVVDCERIKIYSHFWESRVGAWNKWRFKHRQSNPPQGRKKKWIEWNGMGNTIPSSFCDIRIITHVSNSYVFWFSLDSLPHVSLCVWGRRVHVLTSIDNSIKFIVNVAERFHSVAIYIWRKRYLKNLQEWW